MLTKELKLDVEALLSQLINGKGYLHYGLWDGMDPQVACLADVGKAQQQYFDRMVLELPPSPARILDVGSGTGANAAELISRGYEVECVCPSSRLNALARAKLGSQVVIHEMGFEKFESEKVFDAVIFAESFHYIELEAAIDTVARLNPSCVVIFDYFGRYNAASVGDKTRQSAVTTLNALEQGLPTYRVIKSQDLTSSIAPTFDVLDRLNRQHVAPFIDELKNAKRGSWTLKGWFFHWLLNRLYRAPKNDDADGQSRAYRFSKQNEYRLVLLKRS